MRSIWRWISILLHSYWCLRSAHSAPPAWHYRSSCCPSAVEVLAQALSQSKRSALRYLTDLDSFRYLGPSPRMRALAKKLSLNLRKPAASFGVSNSRSGGIDCFTPIPLLELFFISLTSTSNECAPRTEAQTSPCSRIYLEEADPVVTGQYLSLLRRLWSCTMARVAGMCPKAEAGLLSRERPPRP